VRGDLLPLNATVPDFDRPMNAGIEGPKIQAAWMIWLGYLVGRLMGWTPWESLVAGAIVSISGAVIVAKAFEEVRVDSRVRELVFGVVLCRSAQRENTFADPSPSLPSERLSDHVRIGQ
jgi:predicted Kef-type K+ transport protein